MHVTRADAIWLVENCADMMDTHYAEVPRLGRENEFDLDLDRYLELEANGLLLILVAHEDDKPVGYIVGVAAANLHHKDSYSMTTAAFYMAPEYRGKGLMKELFMTMAGYAKECGVYNVKYVVNESFPAAHGMMQALGLTKLETTYNIDLGGSDV